jgi:hypothetical protein
MYDPSKHPLPPIPHKTMMMYGTLHSTSIMLPLSDGLLPLPHCAAHLWQLFQNDMLHIWLLASALLLRHSIPYRSFAVVLSRQPSLSPCSCSATDCPCHPLTCLHCSVPPLIRCSRPLPHPTLIACPLPQIRHLSILCCCIRHALFCSCHIVVGPPLPFSLDSHRHPLLCCRVVAPPLPLDRC